MTDSDLIERLEASRIILKSGDYDGADLMRAWCAMMDARDTIEALQRSNAEMREAARNVLDRKFSTFKAGNGRHISVEGDDGEKCWIVHSDDIFALEQALSHSSETPDAAV